MGEMELGRPERGSGEFEMGIGNEWVEGAGYGSWEMEMGMGAILRS